MDFPQYHSAILTEAHVSEPLVCDLDPVQEPWHKYRDTRVFGSLDGVRALCIFAVIWHHVPHVAVGPRFLDSGFLGVDMFFVLSGFLIVTLLLREKARYGVVSLSKFYARRTLRIFPIYYLLLFTVLFGYLIFKPFSSPARQFYDDLPFLLSYTSNWVNVTANNLAIMWSLATEEQFYLVWPTIERYLSSRWALLILLFVILLNQIVNFGLADHQIRAFYGGPEAPVPSIWQATFTPIAFGVLLAHWLHERKSFTRLFRILGWRWTPIALFALLVTLIQFCPSDLRGLPRLTIQITMMMLLGSLVVHEDHAAARVLNLPSLRFVGMISYGMYLYHMHVVHIVQIAFVKTHVMFDRFQVSYATGTMLNFLACVLGTVLVAGLSYRLIEQPILRLKSRFSV